MNSSIRFAQTSCRLNFCISLFQMGNRWQWNSTGC